MSGKTKILLKKHKELDTIWHPDSTLVFKSSKEKVVNGRWVDNEFIPLDIDAVNLCRKWSFKYDEDIAATFMDEEEEEEGEEEVEEGAEEGEEEGAEEGAEEDKEEGTEEDKEEGTEEVPVEEETVPEVTKEVVIVKSKEVVFQKESVKGGSGKYMFSTFHEQTSKLNSQINSLVDDYNKNLQVIEDYSNHITMIEEKLSNKSKEVDILQAEHNKLKAKFEGIKNLFN